MPKFNVFGWHPVAVCYITPKQNCIVTSIFFQIWNTTYLDMGLIVCQIWIKKIFFIVKCILYKIKISIHFVYSKFKLFLNDFTYAIIC